jgi:arginase
MALRDLDEGEKQIIKSLGILAFTMHDIDKLGIHRFRITRLPLPPHSA